MKKLLLFAFVFMAAAYAQAAFVPNPSVLYNIVQTNSGLVIGGLETSPSLQTVNQKQIQAFSFIPVTGLADTYYLKNEDGNYLNKQTAVSGDYWSVTYAPAINGQYSEWVIVGDATGFRLMLTQNSLYLSSDNTTSGSGIYCDKSADHVNGLFTLQEATVIREFFDISEKNMILEIEKDFQSYPINISTGGISENIYARATNGFSIDKTTFTTDDVANASGKLKVRISATAAVGSEGKVYFAIGTGVDEGLFDSISLLSVAKQPRFFIINNSDETLVIGNHSTAIAPALTTNTGDITQKFLIRKVNPSLNDSLYYFMQDGDYRTIAKDITSNWQVIFGAPADEAKWKIIPQADSITCSIMNFVTGKALGADAITPDNRLYDDKTFAPAPTAKPYCEWKIVDVETAVVPEIFILSDNDSLLEIEKDFQSYPVNITTNGIKETIDATVSNGFSVDKNAFTKEEVLSASGKVKLRISTTAAAGTNGSVIFSHGTGTAKVLLDTVSVTSVVKYQRYYIENKSTEGLVIGFDSTLTYPAITTNTGDISQKFILRPAHPSVNDSLFYIIQDGEYQMMKKSTANAWDVIYGFPANEAIWKISNQESGNSRISNFVTGKDLGADTTLVSSRLWDDKVFLPSPATKPYCEWKFNSIGTGIKKVEGSSIFATVSDQFINIHGTITGDRVEVYNLYGQLIQKFTAESTITSLNLKSGVYLVKVNAETLKVVK